VTGLTEVFDLTIEQQQQLMIESNGVASRLNTLVQADKMNVAALGNVVSQLHIHHVARFIQDDSWPAPVWGKGESIPYSEQESDAVIEQLKSVFKDLFDNGI